MIIGIHYILFCRTFYKWENYFKSIHHYRKNQTLDKFILSLTLTSPAQCPLTLWSPPTVSTQKLCTQETPHSTYRLQIQTPHIQISTYRFPHTHNKDEEGTPNLRRVLHMVAYRQTHTHVHTVPATNSNNSQKLTYHRHYKLYQHLKLFVTP